MAKFAIIGVGGYVAPKHLKAIYETENSLEAAFDVNDSVGVLDSYFPNVNFFIEFERFDRHIDKLKRRNGMSIDYVSICSPNYLHDAHIRFSLRSGAHAICEKPLVLSPWNLDALAEFETEYERKINTILQLRLHPAIIELKKSLDEGRMYDIDLTYITPRGPWYLMSWKGNQEKSGGVVTNIGIHFFDVLICLFGDVVNSQVHLHEATKASGVMQLKNAVVRWYLSVDANDLPPSTKPYMKPFRSMTVDGQEVEFSSGFTDLHTQSYRDILSGSGFGIEDARRAIEAVYNIRSNKPVNPTNEYHPYLKK
ncbi:Gfo/Idh/MocA family oxidoreductase [Hahella sp. KA22]|uniref:Gfo/Idh/MocA family oxidoreductase n=1 Tax=Hahella sp. KA22 TaxID=1628392 RepID=UPI000FDEA651|nr:Gfo/Idh/MocA family oxidoreductase [Hahella sp. KA22]AZZ91658.1 Gfo/Idh/MocA family oxidoreductase [Hahella sp. KA22]QAY55028.1 Gfo/Idh/MocA family oxidoreductase [Hahella sp. KA22]